MFDDGESGANCLEFVVIPEIKNPDHHCGHPGSNTWKLVETVGSSNSPMLSGWLWKITTPHY